MIRIVLTPVLLLLAWAASTAGESNGIVVDQPVRFVNDRVLTIGDIRNRNALRVDRFRRTGRVLPDTPAAMFAFNRETLEDLTDEELLVQKADELQVAIGRDRLAEEVVAEARRRNLDFRDMAILRTIRERQAKVDAVLGWFEGRAPNPGPQELRSTYDRHRADFSRPARAQALLLVLRPTPPEDRQAVVKALAGLMRDVQAASDPQIRALATERVDEFLAADSAGQERILSALAGSLAVRPPPAGPDGALITNAVRLNARWHAIRDRAQCQATLEALRGELVALPAVLRGALFRDRAQLQSQGPHAADGGELGWVEPGTYGAEIEDQALALPPGEPSAPFAAGGTVALLLVLRREAERTQAFGEVSSMLQASLDDQRRDQVRRRVTTVLRSQASIRDIGDLKELLR